jgi:hypothetical protein
MTIDDKIRDLMGRAESLVAEARRIAYAERSKLTNQICDIHAKMNTPDRSGLPLVLPEERCPRCGIGLTEDQLRRGDTHCDLCVSGGMDP